MPRTPLLDRPAVERLAHSMYTVFHTALAPVMKLHAIYGIAIPNDVPFGPTDADALVPDPFVVYDAFANSSAPAFGRLQLNEELDVVLVAITGNTHEVLHALTLPTYAAGMVVASEATLAGIDTTQGGEADVVTGYLVTAAAPGHTYAVAGIPNRKVYGELPSTHPDVTAVTAVVNKTCCRTN